MPQARLSGQFAALPSLDEVAIMSTASFWMPSAAERGRNRDPGAVARMAAFGRRGKRLGS